MKIETFSPVFTDKRGSIFELLAGVQVSHIGYITSKKGSIRGKHYHKIEEQYTVILHGSARIIIKNLAILDSTIEIYNLKSMEMIKIPPLHYHSVEALEDSELLFFSTIDRSGGGYENDTILVEDINAFTKLNS